MIILLYYHYANYYIYNRTKEKNYLISVSGKIWDLRLVLNKEIIELTEPQFNE